MPTCGKCGGNSLRWDDEDCGLWRCSCHTCGWRSPRPTAPSLRQRAARTDCNTTFTYPSLATFIDRTPGYTRRTILAGETFHYYWDETNQIGHTHCCSLAAGREKVIAAGARRGDVGKFGEKTLRWTNPSSGAGQPTDPSSGSGL